LLTTTDLKTWLHKPLVRLDKLLLILSTFEQPCQIKDIGNQAGSAGFRIPKGWNVSSILERSGGLAIRTHDGWELADTGRQHLQELGISSISSAAVQVATDLRSLLSSIASGNTRNFMEEAIKCYELKLYRSAVVMSWLAAVDVLHDYVYKNCLSSFNTEAKRVYSKWKDAKSTDDLGTMNESDFLDRIVALSIIGKNVKKELKDCLDRRNGCGHPNSLRIGQNTVAHHLEVLLLNVFQKF